MSANCTSSSTQCHSCGAVIAVQVLVTVKTSLCYWWCRANAKRDGTRAETRIGLSAKRTSPFQSAGGSVQSTTGSRGLWSVDARRLATHSIRMIPLHFPSRASPCAIRSRVSYTEIYRVFELAVGQEIAMGASWEVHRYLTNGNKCFLVAHCTAEFW